MEAPIPTSTTVVLAGLKLVPGRCSSGKGHGRYDDDDKNDDDDDTDTD